MTAGRDPDRLIQAYLDEGLTELPDRAYDAVRSEIDQTRQRVVIGPWRVPSMSNFARIAIAGAAVLLVAVAGIYILPKLGGVGGPGASPTPSPLPSTSAMILPETGDLVPGTYYIDGDTIPQARRMSFTVPAGWISSRSSRTIDMRVAPELVIKATDSGRLVLGASAVDRVYGDSCHWRGTLVDAGDSVAELTGALAAQSGRSASATTDVTVDGFAGRRIELTTPDQNAAFCDGGLFHDWPAAGPNDDVTGQFSQENETDVVYVVDVAGSRLVIVATHSRTSTPQEVAELDSIVASIRIEP